MYAALALVVVGLVVASAGSAGAMLQDGGIAQTDAPETETLETAENESGDTLENETEAPENETEVEHENETEVEHENETEVEHENETEVEHEEDHIDGVDDDTSFSVSQKDARTTADEAVPAPETGSWSLTEISVHEADGYYEYEYALVNASSPGEAEVRVDGSTGDVFRFEQEIESDEEPEEDIETAEDAADDGDDAEEEADEGEEAEEEADEGEEAEDVADDGDDAEDAADEEDVEEDGEADDD
ncbi:MAG: hypothetical protein ACI8XM_001985 [Haloarculaceae archaeon]|jgi:hypothetical protein